MRHILAVLAFVACLVAGAREGRAQLTLTILELQSSGSYCAVHGQLTNGFGLVADWIAIEFSAHNSNSSTVGSDRLIFRNIDPGTVGLSQALLSIPCGQITEIKVRRISTCRMQERERVGCYEALSVYAAWNLRVGKIVVPQQEERKQRLISADEKRSPAAAAQRELENARAESDKTCTDMQAQAKFFICADAMAACNRSNTAPEWRSCFQERLNRYR